MVKTKQRRTGRVPVKKSRIKRCLIDSSDSEHERGKDDWVIVKKQRVIILVPAAPISKRSIMANDGLSHMHVTATNTSSNHSKLPMVVSTVLPPVNEQGKTISLATQKETQEVRKAPSSLPKSTLAKLQRVDQRIEFENPHQMIVLKSCDLLGVCKTSKTSNQPSLLLKPSWSPNLGAAPNQGLRAPNLERKLQRVGGLSRWLTSLGLAQFLAIFQGKSLSKYQLVNLTLKKLKDMGANAVGPRRKLIHAIDCVCQPYCFKTSWKFPGFCNHTQTA